MINYDPYAEEVIADPHPIYRRMRDEAPAYYVEKYDAWAISRFQDIWDVSIDSEHFSSAGGTLPAQVLTKQQPVIPILNYVDPPEHTVLRRMFAPLFSPAAVKTYETAVRGIAIDLLEPLNHRGEIDVMNDFAMPLASRFVSHVIGVPSSDRPRMDMCVQRFFAHDPSHGGISEDGVKALEEINAYAGELVEHRRRHPTGAQDAVNALLAWEQSEHRRLSPQEAGMHLGMLVAGGSETIAKGITLLIALLGTHPDQRQKLIDSGKLIGDAFFEALRYDNPTQFLCRTVARDTTLHGLSLRAGQGVMLLYASGNRDERAYDRPEVFDVQRRRGPILSFSAGPHICLGVHLARLEARVAVEELLARHPHYELDLGRAERIRTEFVKGYVALPMLAGPRAANFGRVGG